MKTRFLLLSAVALLAFAATQVSGQTMFGGGGGGSGTCSGAFCAASSPLSPSLGGNGVNNSAATGVPIWSAGTQTIQATTGSGNVVRATSPTLVTPALGTPSAVTLTNATGLPVSTGISGLGTGVATALGAAVSGSGSICLSVGSACSGGGSGLTVGTTTITSGTTGRVLYDNGGVLGELVTTGSGNVVLATSPTLTTPNLGTPSAITLTNATGLPVSTGISGLGTGVATALGTNVGSAGAPVVNGGALGTPSSGTLTNATGLPVSTGVSGLGTGVATALGIAKDTTGGVCTVGGSGCPGGGSGTVTQVNTGACMTGGPITTTGTIAGTYSINAQTGTSYTVLSSDACKLVTFSNASSVAVTLPQATGSFAAGYAFDVQNKGAGTVTITPTTSTINGSATLTLAQNTGCSIVSDGTNYQVSACTAISGGGSGTVTTTGSPASGNLAKFSGSTSVTNADLTGDVTTSGGVATTVGKVNGVAYSASPSTDTIPVITASNTATYKAVPDCQDSGGNHLNYTASTHALSCGTSSSGGGSSVTANWITGLRLGTNTSSSISVLAGNASDTTNAASMTTSSTFYGSVSGAWTSGAGSSGSPVNKMGNGLTVASGTWYFVCMANNAGTPDFWFDTSSSCANRPSGISDTKYRVVGMFRTCTAVLCSGGASTSIAPFVSIPSPGGIRTLWNFDATSDGIDVNGGSLSSQTRALQTLSVPTGFKVKALFSLTDNASSVGIRVMSPDEADLTVAGTAASNSGQQPPDLISGSTGYYRMDFERMTDTSSRIAVRASGAVTGSLTITTRGWEWDRGMNGQ